MLVSKLPKVELPTEETLNDEDKNITEAFNTILNGYKRSQDKLRKLSKDYIILQTLASTLLREHNESDRSPKKQEIPCDKIKGRKSSPLKFQEQETIDDILTVDLTFETQSLQQPMNRSTSPIFGRKWDLNNVSKITESPVKRLEETIDAKKKMNQHENALEQEITDDNDENTPPLASTSFKIPESESNVFFNESKPVARIGIAKSVYSIDTHRTPSGKRSRQSTLLFEPQVPKKDLISCEKQLSKTNFTPKWDDLFDENYRSRKKQSTEIEEKQKNNSLDDSIECETDLVINSKTTKNTLQKVDESTEQKDESILIETPSQIDETARSLFEDEDDFDETKDLLNTCMDSPVIDDAAFQQPANYNVLKDERNKNDEAIASTSKATQLPADSIDETFFPLGELEITKRDKREKNLEKAAFTSIVNDSREQNRNLKRKSAEETQLEAEKELADFGAQDIDWDTDITTDNWPPPKRALNSSFDIVPVKKKSSPEYAHKGKVERNLAARAKLRGWDCKDCEKYYGNKNLTEKELEKHINRCSRHRSKYNPRLCTPKDFWNPVFPESHNSDDEIYERKKK